MRQFAYSYLTACLFVLTLALGNLFFMLLHFVTRASWSVVVRRWSEHVSATLPLITALMVPLGFMLRELYPWAHQLQDPVLLHRHPFMNVPFFVARALIILLAWSILASWFRRQSLKQDKDGDPAITRRLQAVSAPALVVLGVTMTLAAFDWIMSLDAHWYSTMFGVYFFSGAVVGGLCLLSIIDIALGHAMTSEHLHDLGKLLFAFVCFWAYIGFSQFLLIWYADIPEETAWYALRLHGSWRNVTIALAIGHFIIPFFFLLPREIKRRRSTLLAAAVWILAMHYLDIYWQILPALHADGPHPHLFDALTLIVVIGAFSAAAARSMFASSPIPTGDPRLPESVSLPES